MAKEPATKRKEKAAATRETLLGHARALFNAKGYDAVGVREVAQAAGMSTGAIFASYTGKAQLYEAATGKLPPDVARFLDRLLDVEWHTPVQNFQIEAIALRLALFGDA